jgi:hypothetical protein
MLDQNLPHQLGADREEVFALLELTCALLFQAQIRLMHQGGALQGVARTFIPQVIVRNPSELVINERNRGAQRFVVAGMPVRQ